MSGLFRLGAGRVCWGVYTGEATGMDETMNWDSLSPVEKLESTRGRYLITSALHNGAQQIERFPEERAAARGKMKTTRVGSEGLKGLVQVGGRLAGAHGSGDHGCPLCAVQAEAPVELVA